MYLKRAQQGLEDDDEYARRRKEGDAFLKRHARSWTTMPLLDAYRELFGKKSAFKPFKNHHVDLAAICEHSQAVLDAGRIEREDLAPLAYLTLQLTGWKHLERFEHIAVDEAQDLNALEFALLRRLSANGSFTIMGDLSQGIHSYRSIASWNVVIREVFADAKAEYREILHSYRSAKEIIDLFNRVMPHGHSRAIPVYEIGRKPTAERVAAPEHAARRALEMLDEFCARGAKSVALITKRERQAASLHAALTKLLAESGRELPLHLLTAERAAYSGGFSVLPVALAKGLEFDGVIVCDASADEFQDTPLDARLLYVALSRAMHQLHIFYQRELTPLLRSRSRKK